MGRSFRTRISWRTARRISTLAREAATLVARFMAENASEFGKDVEFRFERKIAAPMNKMMIGRLGSRVQSTLDSFFR
jgi:hypothetical protein